MRKKEHIRKKRKDTYGKRKSKFKEDRKATKANAK